MRKLSSSIIDGINTDILSGMATRRIAYKYKVSQSAVSRIARQLSPDRVHPKSGQPVMISLTTRRYIIRQVTNGNLDNVVEVQRHLKNEHGIDITAARVCQTLRQEDLMLNTKRKSQN